MLIHSSETGAAADGSDHSLVKANTHIAVAGRRMLAPRHFAVKPAADFRGKPTALAEGEFQ
jgi:hypothetical protein